MSKNQVLLLMSGGVDSSVAGALLIQEGFHVVGVTMKQLDVEPGLEVRGGCCSYGDVRDAKRVAASLGIAHYTINTAPEFHRRVIDPFIRAYEAGLTPNPCVRCNSFVRFDEALTLARQWDCEWVATGHYAQVGLDEPDSPRLFRAVFREKDQSYFLYGIRPHLLKRIRFPLGGKTKDVVRAIARDLGLVTAGKPESQEICFTLGRSYNEFLAQHIESREGPILNRAGEVLGTHPGVTHYTVGQRQGLGLSGGPYYVCEIDASRNAVIVGRREDLAVHEVTATATRWIHPPRSGERVFGQLRSRHQPAPATVAHLDEGTVTLRFDDPQYGAAPGQALVVSREAEILGGGMIIPPKRKTDPGALPGSVR